ncbi:IgGFc-binding protein-like [Chelonoidis abingdonii]|uniref:IgGFc-binding protein-like n=1 Tax=Chelonoidis abingdonii TaxID=106734 RepID=UPI003F4963C4
MIDGQPECLPVSAATCWAGGYLHYHTFDGRLYDIHGTCTYTVAKTCGCDCDPHSFDITADSGKRGNTQVSYIGLLTIQVDGITITVARAEVGFVRVNNTRAHLPISLNNGALRLYQSGTSLVLRTDFNLRVSYDWNNHLRVTVPNDFSDSLCGLCGNYNRDRSDDFWTPVEDQEPSVILQEQSLAVEDEDQFCWHDCIGGCRLCAPSIARKYKEEALCGLITKVSDGPFSQCHSKVDPTVYFDNCVYDLCHNEGYRKALCEALKTYADTCQLEGVRIGEWRQLARCPMECPLENSQYQLCGTACPATCVDQSAPSSCQDPCVESCQCKDGFVLSQGKCVPKGSCGCLFEGRPFAPNESFWVDEACGTQCTCNAATRQVECVAAKCKRSERCGLVNGIRGCYPSSYATCSVTRNLHYATFDGQRYNFQGTCHYQLTALCKKGEGLVDFEVYFQENSTAPVQIKVYETDIRISNQLPGKIMVNSFLINLPFNLDKKITMYRKGWATVIQTDFGLSVTYARRSGRTTVTLPVTYAGTVCDLSCPLNSHYELCSSSCDLTCSNLYAPVQCMTQCKEGCVCDEGFVLSGDLCVPFSQCGCLHRGLYYQAGETFHPSGSCEEQCVCQAGGEVVCKAFSCSTGEQCRVVDGVQKCHPFGSATCSASGHSHYLSFDGVPFDFQGTCTYILAKTCTDANHLTPFTISIEKESWGSGNVSMAKLVSIQVYGITLTLLRNIQGLIMVDGVFHNLPVIMANRRLQAYQHGTNILVQTDFGLIVNYDLVYQARVTVPQQYQGHTCGLCGNYSGRQDSQFLLPSGRTASDVAAFGYAWEVQVPGASCVDRCAGNSCPVCEERKKDVFKQRHYCGLLTAPDSPFTACHGTVSPSVYFHNCLSDLCLGKGDSQVLCQIIHSYVTACQEAKVTILPWRSASFCQPSCSVVLCREGTICKMINGQPECVPVSQGTCWAGGYLHYHTFDGRVYDFHGTCNYTVAKTCRDASGLPSFHVTAKNENRGNTQVFYIWSVTVQVDGVILTAARTEVGFVWVNNTRVHLPISLNNGALRLYQSGTSLVLRTDFNLRVSYDWNNHLRITVPNDFSDSLCGLCGNYNGDHSDDFQTPDGDQAPTVAALGKSWAVEDEDYFCWHDCIGGCRPCDPSIARKYKEEALCGLITKVSDGPFSRCHSKVDPTVYLDNCVYDLCHNEGYRKALCEALKAYADACQLEGVRIGEWRQLARCSMECPLENSQYQLCGTACSATCVDQSAPSSCQDPCVESCQCKDGFVLSQGKCIPKSSCGCLFEGRPYAPSESFWVDEACGTRCMCNGATRQVECMAAMCKRSERCGLVNGVRGCYPSSYATCSVTRNLHYATFDGQRYDFQGTCHYQLTALCKKAEGLVDFEVYFQESNTGPVQIKVYKTDIRVSNQFPGKIMVNGFLITLPFNLNDKKITMYRKGWATVIQTDFGLTVTYAGWSGRTTVTLPVTYAGAVCGLCGNFNSDSEDDMLMRDGTLAPNPISFGQSWKVGDLPGCSAVMIPPCASIEAIEKEQRGSRGQCGLIIYKSGPFRGCHRKVDPNGYFIDCVYGYCVLSGRESNVCQAVAGYAEACQEAGAMVHPWRTTKFCSPSCPPNSHYEFCSTSCDLTCSNLYAPVQCITRCKEGCMCDEGFVLSGDRCVPISQCGCLHRGIYYQAAEIFHPSGSCKEQCVCQAGGEVVCKAFSCGSGEECGVVDGIQKCHPFGSATCSASGHPHYLSFDGVSFDFQGTCTYILAKTCTDARDLTPFTISVEKEDWGTRNMSMAKLVSIQVYGITLTLLQNKQRLIMVNGVSHNLPVIVADGQLRAYQHGTNILVQTNFGLTVSYDLVYQARVTIPGSYEGQTCGLCGNYKGQEDKEFLLPDGSTAPDAAAFGSAWEVQIPGASCTDRCAGNSCPVCEERKKNVFKGRNYCGLLTDPDGPFTACHGTVSPSVYQSNCLYDLCLANGDAQVLCQSIHSYVTACQEVGASIQPWRNTTFCPVSCPVNSHYKICAELCTTTCSGDIMDCPKICAEGCECEDGFFYDGQGCVTAESCGCFKHGRYYKPRETILTNECQQSCTCVSTREVTCKAHSCAREETCQIRDGIMDCISKDPCKTLKCRIKERCKIENGQEACVPAYTGICQGSGDAQYQTFDGLKFDLQDTCKYTIAKYCGSDPTLESFTIDEKNDNRGNQEISFWQVTNIYVYGYNISIYKREVGKVRLNSVITSLPVTLKDGKIKLYQKDLSTVLQTDFGLQITYDKNWHVVITLPSSYYGAMCGLCGNFNQNPDDDMMSSKGTSVSSIMDWADSWKVQDRDPLCWDYCQKTCPKCDLYGDDSHCGMISKALGGPFRECHSRVSADDFFDSCIYDMCLNEGDKSILCEALEAYANACRRHGVTVDDWRTPSSCDPCKALKCRTKETCRTEDGHTSCIPDYMGTCLGSGDMNYQTFDGLKFDFQGTCTYTLAKYCGSDATLEPFTVDEKNANRENQDISFLRVTNVYIYGYNISIYKREVGKVRLNGVITSLPVMLKDGKIRLYQKGLSTVMQTDVGLRVGYNKNWHLEITLPSSYYGAVCGLCGNFNQNPGDDMMSSNGIKVSVIVDWASSWKVQDRDPFCWDYCQETCPMCDESKRELYGDDSHCGVISKAPEGPFRECHSRVSPDRVFDNCIYDVCLNEQDKTILCASLEAYADFCRDHGVTVYDWRTPSSCDESRETCQTLKCRTKETCKTEDGHATCVPDYVGTCWGWGDPHYHTFDGLKFDFQGTCTYTIAKYCGHDRSLEPFTIDEKNDNRGSQAISFLRVTNIYVYGYNISIYKREVGKVRESRHHRQALCEHVGGSGQAEWAYRELVVLLVYYKLEEVSVCRMDGDVEIDVLHVEGSVPISQIQ